VFFPLWGTCFGFQNQIQYSAATGKDILSEGFNSDEVMFPITYVGEPKNSYLFSTLTDGERNQLSSYPSTFNAHKKGVTRDSFYNDAKASSFYKVTSVSTDLNGVEFIASVEAFNYPFIGVQWHSEVYLKDKTVRPVNKDIYGAFA
jgi:anthranilate/para-aminobenzoate synthase component II